MYPLLNDFMNTLPNRQPLIHKAIYPRHIVPPPGYTNPRFYGCTMWSQLRIGFEPDMTLLPHVTGIVNCLTQIVYRVPTYFVRSEFAQAVAQTDPPEDFKLSEIKWPLPAMLFVLPTDFVLKYFGYLCPFISVAHVTAGIYPHCVLKQLPECEMPLAAMNPINNQVDRLTCVSPCYSKDRVPVDYTGSFPTSMNVSAMVDAPFEDATYMEEAKLNLDFDPHQLVADVPSGEAEKVFQNKMQMFAVKLMLLLTARPGIIKVGGITRPEKVKKGYLKRDSLWGPNLIGWEYRANRALPEKPTEESAKEALMGLQPRTHASPRMHWRRGHMRNQPFGPKPWTEASERRLTWIEPVLINAPDETNQ